MNSKFTSALSFRLWVTVTIVLCTFTLSHAQVGIGVASAHASAQLDVTSTNKGFLPPRLTNTQKNAIPSPAAGLIVWCSNCGTSGELQVYNGTKWTRWRN